MLEVRYHPELVTPALVDWLRTRVTYDAAGRFNGYLKDELAPLPPELAHVAAAFPGRGEYFVVVLQAYRHGRTSTPCHDDGDVTGFSFILSVGATRTFRVHRVTGPCDAATDVVDLHCPSGTVILMEGRLHDAWHHQLREDPGVTEERFGVVFRTRKGT